MSIGFGFTPERCKSEIVQIIGASKKGVCTPWYKLLLLYSSRCVQRCQIDGTPIREWSADEQWFFVDGMRELELPGMEVVCVDPQYTCPVAGVTDNRVAECMCMETDLMCSSGARPRQHDTRAVGVPGEYTKSGVHRFDDIAAW